MSENGHRCPTILAGWDGGDGGRDALALASLLARERGARVVAVHVQDHRAAAGSPGCELRLVQARSPARGLRRAAEEEGADLIVLGSSGHATSGRTFPGSTATRLLHGAPCAVTLAPAGYASEPADRTRVVMVAFDGSPESRAAVGMARAWALASGATVRLVGVSELGNAGLAAPELLLGEDGVFNGRYLRDELEHERAALPSVLRADARLLKGEAATRLLGEADLGVDLLVTGSRGYGVVRRVLLGSVSNALVRHAPCAVMVAPRSLARRPAPERTPEMEAAGIARLGMLG